MQKIIRFNGKLSNYKVNLSSLFCQCLWQYHLNNVPFHMSNSAVFQKLFCKKVYIKCK